MNITHRPKGSMCLVCRFAKEYTHCDDLTFQNMQRIGEDSDGTIVVKCSHFERNLTTNNTKGK